MTTFFELAMLVALLCRQDPVEREAPRASGDAGGALPSEAVSGDELAEAPPGANDEDPYIQELPPEGAPRPGEATGITRSRRSWKQVAWVPRALLYIPRRTIEMLTLPLRWLMVAYDRYALQHRVSRIFFDDTKTFGLWPVFLFETGFGANGGLRVVHNDLFGKGERLWLRGSWGGLFRQIYELRLDSGHRLGRVKVNLYGRYDARPHARFFGIGNGPTAASDERRGIVRFQPRIDPIRRNVAVDSRYSIERVMSSVTTSLTLSSKATLSAVHTLTWARFGAADVARSDPQLALIYDVDHLMGYRRGLLNLYHGLVWSYDGLEVAAPHIPESRSSRGWRMLAYTGVAHGLAFDRSLYGRLGLEVQRFIDLFAGDRVLRLRGRADWVIGERNRIPFIDLVQLGGPRYLRGFVRGRFRDRFATLVSAEYFYPISSNLAGFLFLDAGRVWSGPRELLKSGLRDTRFGYGGGVEIYGAKSFLARVQVAASVEGGVFVELRFNPSFSIKEQL